MPTPFSHLATITTLLDDERIPPAYRDAINTQRPAFVLGSVAPDARVDAPDSRAATHFYTYQGGITIPPWRVMMDRYPALKTPQDAAHRAFLAGYVAHLAMDAVWTQNMLGPHFAFADWGESQRWRFFVLHLLLIDMDERDLEQLPEWAAADMNEARPAEGWLPFMTLDVLKGWQTLIYEQIRPHGASQTLDIFGERVGREPSELRQLADDPAWMQANIWDHVAREVLAVVEEQMRLRAREALIAYFNEFTAVRED